jgi:hypothetical protein
LDGLGEGVPDGRRKGKAWKYSIQDAIRCAFTVFFFAYVSLLSFQREMKDRGKRSNLERIFGVLKIPSDNEIRELLDKVPPGTFRNAFLKNLKTAEKTGALDCYKTMDGELLVALDGTWYYSSSTVHCKHCLHKTNKDKEGNKITTWFHSAVAAVIVRSGSNSVIPLMPEVITNEDGGKKQDCEINAGKRWLKAAAKELAGYKIVILGDDLYSNDPFCREILLSGMHFMLTCKPESHPWLTETVENSEMEELTETHHDDGKHRLFIYHWLNDVPIRDAEPALRVNYFTLEIKDKKTGKRVYYNSWITDKPISKGTVPNYASYARTRWKIENEHNNVLKNHGYNLKHNFGHGKEYASEAFFILNLLAFQFHTILDLSDQRWQKARVEAGRRDHFLSVMVTLFDWFIFNSWNDFMAFLCHENTSPPVPAYQN